MEAAFLKVKKKGVFPQFLKNPSNIMNVWQSWFFDIDMNII